MNIITARPNIRTGDTAAEFRLLRDLQTPNAVLGDHQFTRTYTGFSGADIRAYRFDALANSPSATELYDRYRAERTIPEFNNNMIGNIQGISWLTTPDRKATGTMIFTLFDLDACEQFMFGLENHLILVAANEFGVGAVMGLGNLKVTSVSGGISIDDIAAEENLSWEAELYIPWRPTHGTEQSRRQPDSPVEV